MPDNNDTKAIAIPQVFYENSQAKNYELQPFVQVYVIFVT